MAEIGRHNDDDGLILALATGQPVRDAAEQAGVSERTAYRRLEDAEFRRQVSEVRGAMFDQAVGKLADGAVEAVTTLRTLASKAESETVRLSAAKAVLDIGSRLRETAELEQRMADLEQQTVGRA